MKIHEYQAMSLFKEYGIEIVPAEVADNAADAAGIAKKLGGRTAIKAQVLVGGRGKAGGVKLAGSPEEARRLASKILSMRIKSIPVKKVLIAKAVDITEEYYMGITVDRASKRIVFMLSASGGVEIEDLARRDPEKIYKISVEPAAGPDKKKIEEAALKVFKDGALTSKAVDTLIKMYRLFIEKDCSLVEINPYARTKQSGLVAADAKINFDDNAIFKHPEIEKLRSEEEYSREESLARDAGLSFVSMDGDIGCIVNGAGLAMATMDVIKLSGGNAANFLDVGGSSDPKKVLNAIKIILSNRKVRAILINIFGGITRCDDVANGIIMAAKEADIKVPVIIRLIGTNENKGRSILKKAGFVVAEDMSEAVKKAVDAA